MLNCPRCGAADVPSPVEDKTTTVCPQCDAILELVQRPGMSAPVLNIIGEMKIPRHNG